MKKKAVLESYIEKEKVKQVIHRKNFMRNKSLGSLFFNIIMIETVHTHTHPYVYIYTSIYIFYIKHFF